MKKLQKKLLPQVLDAGFDDLGKTLDVFVADFEEELEIKPEPLEERRFEQKVVFLRNDARVDGVDEFCDGLMRDLQLDPGVQVDFLQEVFQHQGNVSGDIEGDIMEVLFLVLSAGDCVGSELQSEVLHGDLQREDPAVEEANGYYGKRVVVEGLALVNGVHESVVFEISEELLHKHLARG